MFSVQDPGEEQSKKVETIIKWNPILKSSDQDIDEKPCSKGVVRYTSPKILLVDHMDGGENKK